MGLLSDFFDAISGNEKDDRIREVLSDEGNYKLVIFDKTTGKIIDKGSHKVVKGLFDKTTGEFIENAD